MDLRSDRLGRDELIKRSEIDRAFRLCLRREVHSEAAYAFFCCLDSLDSVYATIFDSAEFRGRLAPLPQEIGMEPLYVETDVCPDSLEHMLAHVEATWARLGDTEPHWSVITDPRFKPEQFDANRETYRSSGESDEAQFAGAATRAGIDLSRLQTCFELGCGTGRVTEWLARRFSRVIAADISRGHLEAARAMLGGAPNVELLHLRRPDELRRLPPYDAVYSRIVLQHNPPPVIAAILARLLGGLNSGGVAYFQVPVWISGYQFRTADYVAGLQIGPMEMHVLPQKNLLAIVQDAGCRVRELREDPLGPQFGGISNTLLVEKT